MRGQRTPDQGGIRTQAGSREEIQRTRRSLLLFEQTKALLGDTRSLSKRLGCSTYPSAVCGRSTTGHRKPLLVVTRSEWECRLFAVGSRPAAAGSARPAPRLHFKSKGVSARIRLHITGRENAWAELMSSSLRRCICEHCRSSMPPAVQVLYLPDTPDLRVSHQAAVGSGSLASSVGTTSGISTMPSASMSA